jgi:hypothetical protein
MRGLRNYYLGPDEEKLKIVVYGKSVYFKQELGVQFWMERGFWSLYVLGAIVLILLMAVLDTFSDGFVRMTPRIANISSISLKLKAKRKYNQNAMTDDFGREAMAMVKWNGGAHQCSMERQ